VKTNSESGKQMHIVVERFVFVRLASFAKFVIITEKNLTWFSLSDNKTQLHKYFNLKLIAGIMENSTSGKQVTSAKFIDI